MIADTWVAAMYGNARQLWPTLTVRQFQDAAAAAMERHVPTERLSLETVAVEIDAELRRRHGPPEREAPAWD
jgi:hypothetical protein